MAVLSQRLVQDFPQYFHYFDDDEFSWNGRTYKSHNKVTQNFVGADGLKTGYTRASGYNLATTAQRGDHRLIGIVLGGRSGTTRNRHMEEILNNAFAAIDKKPTLVKSVHRVKPVPGLRPDRNQQEEAPILLASLEAEAPRPAAKPLSVEAVAALADNLPPAQIADLVDGPIGEGDADPDMLPRNWIVQVGAFGSQPQAIAQIHKTQETIRDVWPDAGREVNIARKGEAPVYRARFTRLTQGEAVASCNALRKVGDDCLVLELTQ